RIIRGRVSTNRAVAQPNEPKGGVSAPDNLAERTQGGGGSRRTPFWPNELNALRYRGAIGRTNPTSAVQSGSIRPNEPKRRNSGTRVVRQHFGRTNLRARYQAAWPSRSTSTAIRCASFAAGMPQYMATR